MLTQQREKLVPGRREENCRRDDLAVQMAGGLGAAWVLGQGLAGNPFGALLFIPIEVGSKVISPNFHSCFFSSPSSQLTILQSLLPLGFPLCPSLVPTAPALVKFKSCYVGVVTSQPLSRHPLSTAACWAYNCWLTLPKIWISFCRGLTQNTFVAAHWRGWRPHTQWGL